MSFRASDSGIYNFRNYDTKSNFRMVLVDCLKGTTFLDSYVD